MPGEFEPQACVWLAWPGRTTREWAPADDITRAIASIANAIARFQRVRVAIDPAFATEADAMLAPDVDRVPMAVDDIWVRDSGPTFLLGPGRTLAATCWSFNAWGEKFEGHQADRTLAARLAAIRDARAFTAPIITEGGALHVDGRGTVVITESAIANPNRNPTCSRTDIETALCGWLGARKVIWIPGERHDSITDGHVDGLMTFVSPGKVLFEVSEDPTHPLYRVLREQRRCLEHSTDALGRPLEVGRLTRPRPVTSQSPDFCAIYVNCLITNRAVIVPAFGDAGSDAEAQAVFSRAFPDRSIVPLRVDAICAGGGGIHCVTQQEPAGV